MRVVGVLHKQIAHAVLTTNLILSLRAPARMSKDAGRACRLGELGLVTASVADRAPERRPEKVFVVCQLVMQRSG
jgi:hypothetical protein